MKPGKGKHASRRPENQFPVTQPTEVRDVIGRCSESQNNLWDVTKKCCTCGCADSLMAEMFKICGGPNGFTKLQCFHQKMPMRSTMNSSTIVASRISIQRLFWSARRIW